MRERPSPATGKEASLVRKVGDPAKFRHAVKCNDTLFPRILKELFEDSFEVVQVEGVGSVGFGVRRVVVDLKEDSVDSGGYGGAGEDGDELGLATGDAVGG